MDPLEFERIMAEYFRQQGFRVQHTGTGGSASRFDGGIDLKLYRDSERLVVQCKRWTAYQVPHTDVHQLLGVMHTEQATGAIFVTSGEFSNAALQKMRGIANFRMIDGSELRKLLGPLIERVRQAPIALRVEPLIELSAPLASLQAPESRGNSAHVPPELRPIARGVRAKSLGRDLGPILFATALVGVLVVSCVRHMAGSSNTKAPTAKVRTTVPASHAPRTATVTARSARASSLPSIPMTVERPHQPTAEEVRESQRRADEAMKVLEANTPEM